MRVNFLLLFFLCSCGYQSFNPNIEGIEDVEVKEGTSDGKVILLIHGYGANRWLRGLFFQTFLSIESKHTIIAPNALSDSQGKRF